MSRATITVLVKILSVFNMVYQPNYLNYHSEGETDREQFISKDVQFLQRSEYDTIEQLSKNTRERHMTLLLRFIVVCLLLYTALQLPREFFTYLENLVSNIVSN